MESEIEKIRKRYSKRDCTSQQVYSKKEILYKLFLTFERETIYFRILNQKFGELLNKIKFLEIGAGNGYNLFFFARLGIPWQNMWANELLEYRLRTLEELFPKVKTLPGDALKINANIKFDLILISTVLTSILDDQYKSALAEKAFSMLNNNGIIILYDFVCNNPKNRDVKGISRKEIKKLFPKASLIKFKKVTLAPPIGKRIGKAYNLLNVLLPFLRSHVIAVIFKS